VLVALTDGLLLGLATGTYCLVGCVPLLVPHYLAERRDNRWGAFMVVEFLLGRLAAYLVFGVVSGALGESAREWLAGYPAAVIQPSFTIAAGLVLLAGGLVRIFPRAPACVAVRRWPALGRLPFLAGFVLGMSPCPPFLAAGFKLAALGSVAKAVVLSLGFFTASSVYLVPIAFVGRITRFNRIQDVARVLAVLTGLYFTVRGTVVLVFLFGGFGGER